MLANYQPPQASYGGPNYFSMDPNALYEIHIDNNGDAVEDIPFQFRFKNTLQSFPLTVGVLRSTSVLFSTWSTPNGDSNALGLNTIPGVAGVSSMCKASSVPLGAMSANIHDAVDQATVPFLTAFPYLNTPLPGSN